MEGAGIAQWLEHRTRDWKVAGSNPCWNGGRIFFSRVDFQCWLLFRYPFHPRVTAVARKKSRSFCQKCRWQVTAKHAYTLRIEPCFGTGHNLSLICQMTSEDIKHQLNILGGCTSHGGPMATGLTKTSKWAVIDQQCRMCSTSQLRCKPDFTSRFFEFRWSLMIIIIKCVHWPK